MDRLSRVDSILTEEFCRQKVEEGLNQKDIIALTGLGRSSVQKKFKEYGLQSKIRREDLTGKKFTKLLVLERMPGYKGKNTWWKVRCDCGKELTVLGGNLIKGNSKSCGCTRRGSTSPVWKGCGSLSGTIWRQISSSAEVRGIPFSLSIEEAWNLFEKQKSICALTGWTLILLPTYGEGHTASLDRIDSNKGYEISNVQWIHKDVNKMKRDYPEDFFIKVCKAVASNR